MTQKIFRSACLTSLIIITVFFIIVIPITVGFCTDAVKNELKTEAEFLTHGLSKDGLDYLIDTAEKGNRVTLISPEGAVIFENSANADQMENHLDREEIQDALKNGEGYSVRQSKTLSELTVYYAEKLPDGSILRVSGSAVKLSELMSGLTPAVLLIILASLGLSVLLAFRTSRSVARELEKLDLDHTSEPTAVYPELQPILKRLWAQGQLITKQMDELTLRRREFDSITQNMDDGLIIIDERAKILSANKIAASLLGFEDANTEAEQYTLSHQSLLHMGADSEIRNVIGSSLLGTRGEALIRTEEKTYRLIADPVIIDGSVSGVAILMLDETEKEKREELRREFTSNISHELKTPLTSISGFAELIRSGIAGDNVCHFADNIYKEAQRLIILVNDIIKLSRLDGKTPNLDFRTVNLLDTAYSVAERLKNVADSKQISITVSGSEEKVLADEGLLEEILYNLCDNAVKYGKDGGYAKINVGKNSDGRPFVTVSDNGIGIPRDQLDRVFERFYRVDKSHSKSIGGTGLGLSIVKHGVASLNGEISIDSAVNSGTTVTVILPACA